MPAAREMAAACSLGRSKSGTTQPLNAGSPDDAGQVDELERGDIALMDRLRDDMEVGGLLHLNAVSGLTEV